nr:LysE family translocator [Cohnella sp. REN36]
MAFSTLVGFVVVVLGLFLIPGPAVLLTVTRTAQGGRKGGILTGLGIATGDMIHTLFAAVGLSAILMTSSVAFQFVKYAGVAYLLYLGIKAILEKPRAPELPQIAPVSPRKAFGQAVVIEVLNPKTSLFFLAFLPQFVNPAHGSSVAQFLQLGLVFVLLSVLYTTFLALSVGALGRVLRRVSWLGRWSGKIVGAIYISLGVRVAMQQR